GEPQWLARGRGRRLRRDGARIGINAPSGAARVADATSALDARGAPAGGRRVAAIPERRRVLPTVDHPCLSRLRNPRPVPGWASWPLLRISPIAATSPAMHSSLKR